MEIISQIENTDDASDSMSSLDKKLIEVHLLSDAKSRDIYEGAKTARASDVHNWPNRVSL